MFLSAVLLTGVVDSSLLATGVSISTRLQGTAAGQRVVDIYKGLVGKNVRFCYSESSSGELNYYTGEIAAVILPDIRDFIASGDQYDTRLKLEMNSVQAEDPETSGEELPNLIEARNVVTPHLNLSWASLEEVRFPRLGEKISWVRELAIHGKESISLTDTYWEVLVEMESDGDTHVEIENPFIVQLPMFDFEISFPRLIGSEANALESSHSTSDEDSLLLAAEMGDTAEVVRLHENGANLDAKNDKGFTPLMLAATMGKTDTAERLIELGADLEAKDNDGQTPLMLATTMGKTDTAKRLLELGADSKE